MSRTNKTAAVLNLIHGSALSDEDTKRTSGRSEEDEKKHRVVKNPVVLEMESEFETEEAEDKPLGLNGGIINAAFLLVNEKLSDVVQRFKACGCDQCLKEISAKVLDELPPMFVRMDKPDSMEKLEQTMNENSAEVLKALTKTVLFYRTKQHK